MLELPIELIEMIIFDHDYTEWKRLICNINEEYHDKYEYEEYLTEGLICQTCCWVMANYRNIPYKFGKLDDYIDKICYRAEICQGAQDFDNWEMDPDGVPYNNYYEKKIKLPPNY